MADKILRDLYCYHCSLQFDGKLVYDMHQSIKHNYRADEKSVQNFIKCEFNLHEEQGIDQNQDKIIIAEDNLSIQSSIDRSNGLITATNNQIARKSKLKGMIVLFCNFCNKKFYQRNRAKKLP